MPRDRLDRRVRDPPQPRRLPRRPRAKEAALTAAGYRVLRFTRDDDPELAIKRLRALLA
jgi:hypothetical protein